MGPKLYRPWTWADNLYDLLNADQTNIGYYRLVGGFVLAFLLSLPVGFLNFLICFHGPMCHETTETEVKKPIPVKVK